jgi:hypothetical protein
MKENDKMNLSKIDYWFYDTQNKYEYVSYN